MKKLNTLIALLLITVISYAQDGAEHKIINIIGAGRVEINIGEQFDVKQDDVFQVFGRGQIIHPATGSLVERDNVYLGRIKIIEVKALSSIAETIERIGDFSIGNRIIKVASEDQEIVEHKRPLQAEFERPRDRSYSETIYTQRKEKNKNEFLLFEGDSVVIYSYKLNKFIIGKITGKHNSKDLIQVSYFSNKDSINAIRNSSEAFLYSKRFVLNSKYKDVSKNDSIIYYDDYDGLTTGTFYKGIVKNKNFLFMIVCYTDNSSGLDRKVCKFAPRDKPYILIK